MLKRNFRIAMFGFLSLMLIAVASSQSENKEETAAVEQAVPISESFAEVPEVKVIPTTTTTTTTTTLPPEPPTTVKKSGRVRQAARAAPSPSEAPEEPSESAPQEETRTGLEPCGGDLPPCWVKNRESHGNYRAYNPTGCVWTAKDGTRHRGCWGAWQFSGAWAGKLGLPDDLSTATPAQQDAAARQLWNGGRGCGNWAAC